MNGYYKLLTKGDDYAVLDIAGWDSPAVALHRRRVESIKRQLEEIQDLVHNGNQADAQFHLLWEELTTLISATKFGER